MFTNTSLIWIKWVSGKGSETEREWQWQSRRERQFTDSMSSKFTHGPPVEIPAGPVTTIYAGWDKKFIGGPLFSHGPVSRLYTIGPSSRGPGQRKKSLKAGGMKRRLYRTFFSSQKKKVAECVTFSLVEGKK